MPSDLTAGNHVANCIGGRLTDIIMNEISGESVNNGFMF